MEINENHYILNKNGNQEPHTYQVKTQPAYIPGGNITSTLNIDVNAENKADGYIQPFLVQEFLIKY